MKQNYDKYHKNCVIKIDLIDKTIRYNGERRILALNILNI